MRLILAAALLLLTAHWAPAAEEGLVAHWSFDEGQGAIAHDSSGNGKRWPGA